MVLLTPFSQGTHLLSVGRLIFVGDQAYHRCVVCKFDDDVGVVSFLSEYLIWIRTASVDCSDNLGWIIIIIIIIITFILPGKKAH